MTQANTENKKRELRSIRIGVVVSDKRDKTRTVRVEYQAMHPKYGKYLHRSTRFHVHDPNNESKIGDRVTIVNCRPISKTKSWRLLRIVEKAPEPIQAGQQQ